MRKKETATKNRKTRFDYLLSLVGMRMIDGQIAEVPEKIPEEQRSNHGRNDRRRTENTMQDIH